MIKLKDQLEAKETKFFAKEGIVVETREIIDFEQHGRYFDRWAKLCGLYATIQEDADPNLKILRA